MCDGSCRNRSDEPAIVQEPNDDESGPSRLDELRAALVTSAGLDEIGDPEPLVPGILFRGTLAWLYGSPASGKSFIAIDVAGCVGTGEHWQGYGPIEAGTVLYVVAEGVAGIKRRVRAWEKSTGTPMHGVHFLPVAVQSGVPGDWRALVALATEMRPVLIVLDTQARVTVGLEENSAKEMGTFVDQCDRLRKATGACVLIVHHSGRQGEHMRGSIAMEGGAETVIQVSKAEDIITVKNAKQKDAAEFDEFMLRMVPTLDSVVLAMTDGQGGAAASASKWLRAWWATHKDDPVSISVLIKSGVVTEPTFHRWKHTLMDQGAITRVGTGRSTRYVLQADPDAA
jgi:hypothetical protein